MKANKGLTLVLGALLAAWVAGCDNKPGENGREDG